MRVVITGGSGLIGRALTASLIDDGHEVVILTRSPRKHEDEFAGRVELAKWDGSSAEGWSEHADGADAIVNLAGEAIDQRWTKAAREKIVKSRVNAGQAVVEAVKAAKNKPKAVIQSSAVGYYGPHGDEVVTEDTPPGDDFLADVCKQWEASSQPVEAMGVRRAIIRTGIVLSKRGGALAKMLPMFRFFAGGKLGKGSQYMPWIHLSDEINAIRYLIENSKASGPYNLSAPNPVTNKQFVTALGKAMNRPSLLPAPGLAIKAVFGEMATVVLDGQRAVPQHLLREGYKFRFTDLETAFRHLLYGGFQY